MEDLIILNDPVSNFGVMSWVLLRGPVSCGFSQSISEIAVFSRSSKVLHHDCGALGEPYALILINGKRDSSK